MACTSPVTLKFPKRGMPDQVNCGKCDGCLFSRSRSWALRGMLELPYHKQASFLTLTYSDDKLPALPTDDNRWIPTLEPIHPRNFLKRLRKNLGPQWPRISYLLSGEYGDRFGRPHYHVILFGCDFRDPHPWQSRDGKHNLNSINRIDSNYYTSTFLDFLWGHGNAHIGPVTPDTIAYTCRYTLKKQANKYLRHELQTPEFIRVSTNPSIGKAFIEQHMYDVFRDDLIVFQNQKFKPPRYFSELLKKSDPLYHSYLIHKRLKAEKPKINLTAKKIINRYKKNSADSRRSL